ncbi:MAG: hypothetical protein IJ593_05150 [Lachnospiraceae bacterium]|nr:hypothetical protein [Lachnospiraceae bacterium]
MNKKNRLKELTDFVGKDKVIFLKNLIDDIIFMEEKLIDLKQLPFIKVNPKNKEQQKKTESSKLYLSLMAQYTQDIKALSYLAGKSGNEEEMSPLRLYIQNLNEGGKKHE